MIEKKESKYILNVYFRDDEDDFDPILVFRSHCDSEVAVTRLLDGYLHDKLYDCRYLFELYVE